VTPEQTQGYIDSETSRLQELSTQNDPASLAAILTDLTNSDKSIRLAAIDAVKQVGSRDAIPALKAAAADNPDTAEQIALLQAADFLQYVPNALTPDQLQAAWQGRNQTPARHHQTAQTQLAQPPPNQPR
jgi:HEAT repeat protein